MAIKPDSILTGIHSEWTKRVNEAEAEIDAKLKDARSLPIGFTLPKGLDLGQQGELKKRYVAVGWRVKIEHHDIDTRDQFDSEIIFDHDY